ncbi:MAG: ATP-binding protein [Magnetospirillum sp.]|nr:ATP-binding protein [Magnetospirillum sp.]
MASAERNLAAISLALAQQTERAFNSVELVLDATAQSVEAAGGIGRAGGEDMHRMLRARMTGIPQIVGLAIIAPDGRVVNGAKLFPPPRDNRSGLEYFAKHRDDPSTHLHISAPRKSVVDDSVIVPVSRRLSGRDGSFQGIIAAAVDPDYFHNSFRRVLPSEGGASAIFRADGILLARTPPVDSMKLGQDFSRLAIFQADAPAHGLGWGPSPMDGVTRILAYHHLDLYPLVVNVSLREDVLLASWRDNAMRLGMAAALATALLGGAVVVLARHARVEKAQAAALKRSEERLRFAQFALDHAADMVFWLDAKARILYLNEAAWRRLGYESAALIGSPIESIDPHFAAARWPRYLKVLKRRRHVRFETTNLTAYGIPYPAEVAANYVNFNGGDYVCAFVRDISQRKAAEATLAEKTAKLEASNAELEQFAYVASHDLREPLRMISSFIAMLERRYGQQLNEEAHEFIAYAQDGAVRMDRLIRDLLEYSRVGRIERAMTEVSLANAVTHALQGLAVAVVEEKAEIEVAPDLPTVLGSEEELARLMLNLIGNALKYHHPDRTPRVRVGWRRDGNEIVCWVADNGIGIAPQDFDRVFGIFQRLHSRDRYEGTGIGLAICKKIVDRHGGRIWIESAPDQGTTFFFTLKAPRESAAPTALATAPQDAG